MKKIALYALGSLFALSAMAQEGVTGVVVNAAGTPVKNMKYRLNGLIKFSKTNSKGTFKFKRVLEGDTLLIYSSEEQMAKIPLRPNTLLSIQLGDNFLRCKCDTTTVIYRYQVAPKIAYSSSIITFRQIQEFSPSNLIELLRGKIPGLQIQEMSGTSKASIRGVSSMSLNTEPLFIIGGTQYDSLESANNAISIDNILEVEVKKDGSEFGMKGANGVIIIKTR